MHWQAFQFCELIKSQIPELFSHSKVVEIGSHFVNKSIRVLFEDCDYIGVDLSPGNGVDIVSSGDEVVLDELVDLAISCECFEHNPKYLDTFENMAKLTAPGGLVLFSCATTDRPEHGTARTSPESSPGTIAVGWDYYKNLISKDFPSDLLNNYFSYFKFYSNSSSQDLYFVGLRKGSNSNERKKILMQLPIKVDALISASNKVDKIHSLITSHQREKTISLANEVIEELNYPKNPMLFHILWPCYQTVKHQELSPFKKMWDGMMIGTQLNPFDYHLGAKIEIKYSNYELALQLLNKAIILSGDSTPGIVASRMQVYDHFGEVDKAFHDCFLVFSSCGNNLELHIQCANFLIKNQFKSIAFHVLNCALKKSTTEAIKLRIENIINNIR